MDTITYVRPTKTVITVGDTPENRAYAEANGWVEKKKRTRKAKAK